MCENNLVRIEQKPGPEKTPKQENEPQEIVLFGIVFRVISNTPKKDGTS